MSNNQKIEALIVSFGCLDLLSITLPRNLPEFDNLVIITKPEDKETIDYCKSLNSEKITIFKTDAFTVNGSKFNKGFVIAHALKSCLKFDSWIATIDSDILIPKNFHSQFFGLPSNIEKFYGMRRRNVETKQDFDELEKGNKKIEDFILYRGSGFGYFGMCNVNSTTYKRLLKEWHGLGYPFWIGEARDIDWIWRNNWGERVMSPPLGKFPECHLELNNDYDTGLYEELPWNCIHLGIPGMNHEKRITPKFE